MGFEIPAPVTELRHGRRYTTWTITEDVSTTTTQEVSFDVPKYGTIVLVEADLLGAGTAVSIQTAFGVAAGSAWVVDALGAIDKASAAAANIRIGTDKRYVGRGDPVRMFMRSQANANLDGTQSIETRVTIAEGLR